MGSAKISWTAPTTNADGTALTDLAGFTVYYGTSSGSYTQSVVISTAGTRSYTVGNLPTGSTYYFVVKAFDAANNMSTASAEVHKAL